MTAPERVYVWRNEPDGNLVASGPDAPCPNDSVEFVRADKLEELAAEKKRFQRNFHQQELRAKKAEAALAEAKRENEALREALEFYANPNVYAPHPHGPAFDRRDLSFMAKNVLARNAGGKDAE